MKKKPRLDVSIYKSKFEVLVLMIEFALFTNGFDNIKKPGGVQ